MAADELEPAWVKVLQPQEADLHFDWVDIAARNADGTPIDCRFQHCGRARDADTAGDRRMLLKDHLGRHGRRLCGGREGSAPRI
jgi:hypothetical protein